MAKKKSSSSRKQTPSKNNVKRKGRPSITRGKLEREFSKDKPVSDSSKQKLSKDKSEPKNGPKERERQFLEEHLMPIVPKASPAPTTSRETENPETDSPQEEESSLPSNFHRELIQQYRRRQRKPQPPPPPLEMRESATEPPQPPLPPPANNWIPIGPSVLRQGQGEVKPATSGRTPGIAVAPGGERIYIGAANGGVWRSDDSGQTWRSLMDAFDLNPTTHTSDSLAVGAIAIDLTNPNRVYVGSGDYAYGSYFGVGPIVTNNGTASAPDWETEPTAIGSPSLDGTGFYALAVDPANPDRVVAGTYKGLYRREPKSSGGYHWAQKTLGISTEIVPSVVVANAGGTTTFYAAEWGGPVYSSNDGNSWNVIGSGFPTANVSRITLAVQRDNPSIVYALVTHSATYRLLGIYRLNIADGTWRQISGGPPDLFGKLGRGQGDYDSAIAIAPNNVNRIYIGGSTVHTGSDWSGSLFRCEVTVSGSSVSMSPTYIGSSVHADIHAIVFAPGDANKLWVGCDGGVFYSTNPTTGTEPIFQSRNLGLQTLTMEFLGQHPTEDAVLFAGTQDNGGQRFTGEEAWLYSSAGDAGYAIVNWNDPYKILSTYVRGIIRRSIDGGSRGSYDSGSINVPLDATEAVLFYAPIAGTPPNQGSPTAAADADLVAFGSIRPWISTTFGGGWRSIPNNTLAGDSLNGKIRSLVFASPDRLYAGTMYGGVYRFDRSGTTWTQTQIDTMGGADQLPLRAPVTSVAVSPSDSDQVYITIGGYGDYRHVWFFNGAKWQQRSGPSAGSTSSLLDVQANAIVVDSDNPSHLYVGADIGIWRSIDSGANWAPYSEGLPDAAVVDLVLHKPRRLLRAATHGRGVWERTLPDSSKEGIELYVRSTQLDLGRSPALNGLPDPTAPGKVVYYWQGPDIKLDTPNAMGQYQFPLTSTINFLEFVDTLTDDFQNVATHASADIVTRVYVQVHNRGVLPANDVRVMLLLTNASAGLPPLPAGFEVSVRNGIPINDDNWRTIGIERLDDLRVGFPKIAAFDLTFKKLPPKANPFGSQHQCVLALLHHATDQFTKTETNVNLLTSEDRKAAHKNLTLVQFAGMLPPPLPVALPVRINNVYLKKELLTNVVIHLNDYPGKVRLLTPPLKTKEELKKHTEGMAFLKQAEDISKWAKSHVAMIKRNQKSKQPYNKVWSRQRIEDIQVALNSGTVLQAKEKTFIAFNGIEMKPDGYHTFFLFFDRPANAKPGRYYDIDVHQTDANDNRLLGGLSVRVELVPEPIK